jgi:hypothetical protein
VFVGGGRVHVAVGTGVAVAGSGVVDGNGVVVDVGVFVKVGGIGDGVAVRVGVVVGGSGVQVAVSVGFGVGVRLDSTSGTGVGVGSAVLVAIAGWAMGCKTVWVSVAFGDGVVGVWQPAFSPPTIASAIRTGIRLPGRSITQAPCPVLFATRGQSRRQSPPLEQGGVLHRSSRPQQVCPAGRRDWLLNTWGAEKSLSVSRLPHLGQLGVVV